MANISNISTETIKCNVKAKISLLSSSKRTIYILLIPLSVILIEDFSKRAKPFSSFPLKSSISL